MKAMAGKCRIAAMGDAMLARIVGRHIKERPDDFKLEDIRKTMDEYDIVFVNLENPVSTRGVPDPIQEPNVTFRCHPDTLGVLENIGVDIVSIGNNHMLDYGEEALTDTIRHLDERGIAHFGAGADYEEANREVVIERNGVSVAFLSCVLIYSASTRKACKNKPGVSDFRISGILRRIRSLKKRGCAVVVSAHWGMEYSFYPVPYQMRQARMMIDAGAALILGHGPHYPQGIERYKNGRIVYSLGNFIFDEPHVFANRSYIYGADLDGSGRVSGQRIFPFHIEQNVPRLVDGRDRDRMETLVRALSDAYNKKDASFWKTANNAYFRDVVHRVLKMKSLKFVFLPPPSFYLSIGFKNMLNKISYANLASIARKS